MGTPGYTHTPAVEKTAETETETAPIQDQKTSRFDDGDDMPEDGFDF
jgi:hypothetical protein